MPKIAIAQDTARSQREQITGLQRLLTRGLLSFVILLAAIIAFPGCSSSGREPVDQPGSVGSFPENGDQAAIAAQESHAIKVELTVVAKVKKLLPEDNQGLPHQKFLIVLSNGTTILIAHNTKMAERVPLSPGDTVKIHGEYIWNSRGGLIHWTHRTDTPYHEGGWIELNGVRYQ